MPTELDIVQLFDEHAAFLLRALLRLAPSRADAEDVLQDVFLVAHQRRSVVATHDNPRAWLYRVARNVVRHKRRTFARRARLQTALAKSPPGDSTSSESVPDVALARSERVEHVRR